MTDKQERLIEALSDDIHQEDGWLSDAQNARLEWDEDNQAVLFHGEGSIDLAHIAEIAAAVFERYGGAVPPNAEERARVRELLSEPSEAAKEHLRIWRYLNES